MPDEEHGKFMECLWYRLNKVQEPHRTVLQMQQWSSTVVNVGGQIFVKISERYYAQLCFQKLNTARVMVVQSLGTYEPKKINVRSNCRVGKRQFSCWSTLSTEGTKYIDMQYPTMIRTSKKQRIFKLSLVLKTSLVKLLFSIFLWFFGSLSALAHML